MDPLFSFFGHTAHHRACGILAPRPGIKPTPLHWKRGVLTTGPPGKSLDPLFNVSFELKKKTKKKPE